ncbi:MAG: hypothetical protein DSY80_08170, partial [Desulfocapsa sp.]
MFRRIVGMSPRKVQHDEISIDEEGESTDDEDEVETSEMPPDAVPQTMTEDNMMAKRPQRAIRKPQRLMRSFHEPFFSLCAWWQHPFPVPGNL